jgi:hypothetical protein
MGRDYHHGGEVRLWRIFIMSFKRSPFSKGGFRVIFRRLGQIPTDPPLKKGGN